MSAREKGSVISTACVSVAVVYICKKVIDPKVGHFIIQLSSFRAANVF